MIAISSRKGVRNNQAKEINSIYSLAPVTEDDMYFTPEVLAKINKALAQAERGEGVVCKTVEESLKFLESL
jgi:hypothetical protein